MENFPGNSRRAAGQPSGNSSSPKPPGEEQPKLDKVVTGNVIRRRKPLGRRVLDTFFRGDGGVVSYLVMEVLVPTFQNLIVDVVTQGVEKAVRGEVRPVSRTFRGGPQNRTHISYDRPTTITRSPMHGGAPIRRSPTSQPSSIELEEVILDSQFAAQTIGEKLYEAIEDFGAATVANLKELLGETPTYVDHKWGWGEGAEFQVKRVREGFLLTFPDPVHLR